MKPLARGIVSNRNMYEVNESQKILQILVPFFGGERGRVFFFLFFPFCVDLLCFCLPCISFIQQIKVKCEDERAHLVIL